MSRIVIGGGPRTGKTTLANELKTVWHVPGPLRHTDDLIENLTWRMASQIVAGWFDQPGPWIIEGVTVSRALRKWHQQHRGSGPPIDCCIFLEEPYEPLTAGQAAMTWGVATVHSEVAEWLREHGIRAWP